ncbi:polysaccharide biosynthesis tyrosine autokinase [Pseudohalioglobus sediminis]|uniref:non-specific protein-tyrosine kinase n=1 Tax=Pseudohalioglobus sediminis TaxID=2606449 RepID=A0A5B0WR41_9GAMM|nr:polysaccharide biosynthesis tyrosine autokinase [Pseudohalioglobus sediminis]KAA1188918.1 polysaccharide biosynthesis tyrosine autokinase [Pseudohalioglobus sediminis]
MDKNEPVAPDQQLMLADMQKQLARYEDAIAGMAKQQAEPDDDFIDLRELWNMLLRRRWTIIITMAVIVVVTAIATAMMTPIYRATTVVQIERDTGKVLEFQDVTAEESASSRDFYQTQYELLQSRTLARRVIDQLGLEEAPAEQAEPGAIRQLVSATKDFIFGEEEEGEALPPNLESAFLANLTVQPVSNSRLVRLHYDSPDREQAALIVNTIARAYVDMNLERRFEASTYAKSFLEDRIKQVRADLEDSEQALVAYTQSRGIINQEDKQDILMEKLKEMNRAQVQVESQRIEAESQYQEMLTADSDGLAQALDSEVIQGLKARRTELQSEYQESLKIYKPDYPLMQQLQQQIDQVDADVKGEIANIRNGIKIRYQAKLREEMKLAESIAATRDEILRLNESTTDFQTLKREVDTNRELYDGLLQRMKEVGVAAGVANNNISVVDKAEVPRGKHKPKPLMNLMLALVLGGFAGAALAFLFEMLDDSVKSAEGLEKLLGKPVLGIIPKLMGKNVPEGERIALQSYLEPTSAMAEAHRSMRTALMFATHEGAPKVMHFTSASAGEGKTTTAVNTAITFAQTGSNVLLIDGDLRNPSLHKVFAKPNDNGLTNYLTGDIEPARVTQPTGVDNLFLMTSGPIPPNPAELLHGSRMLNLTTLAAKRFDYVVIDGPPLLGLADALLLADVAKGTLLVVAAGEARNGGVEAGLKRLRHSRANLLGGVLTKYDLNKASYGYGGDYGYAYSYSYGVDNDERKSA